jgi:hypothetical protein
MSSERESDDRAEAIPARSAAETRPARAEILEKELQGVDLSAFGDREAYWPMIMQLLKGEL